MKSTLGQQAELTTSWQKVMMVESQRVSGRPQRHTQELVGRALVFCFGGGRTGSLWRAAKRGQPVATQPLRQQLFTPASDSWVILIHRMVDLIKSYTWLQWHSWCLWEPNSCQATAAREAGQELLSSNYCLKQQQINTEPLWWLKKKNSWVWSQPGLHSRTLSKSNN